MAPPLSARERPAWYFNDSLAAQAPWIASSSNEDTALTQRRLSEDANTFNFYVDAFHSFVGFDFDAFTETTARDVSPW